MGASRILSYLDASAPQLQGIAGSLAAVLRAALVDGYGSIPSLGWTLAYEADSGQRLSFRNNPATGTGFYFRLTDNYTTNVRFAQVSAYEQMTGIGAYTNPILASEAAPYWIQKSYYTTAQATATPWWVIGDDRAFWIVTLPQHQRGSTFTKYGSPTFIGDFNPIVPGFAHGFAIVVSGNGRMPGATLATLSYEYFPHAGITATLNNYRVMRGRSGSVGGAYGNIAIGSLASSGAIGYGFGTAHPGGGVLNGVFYGAGSVKLVESSGLIGTIPGMIDPLMYYGTLAEAYEVLTIADAGNTYLLIPLIDSNNRANYLILSAGEGWRDDI